MQVRRSQDKEVVPGLHSIGPLSNLINFEGRIRQTRSQNIRTTICTECCLRRERDEFFTRLFEVHEAAEKRLAGLTGREYQIMELVVAGHPSKNIAADLGISQRTVENHRASIMKKSLAKSLPELARLSLVIELVGAARALGSVPRPLSTGKLRAGIRRVNIPNGMQTESV